MASITTLRIRPEGPLDLDLTVRSHGWFDLLPFRYDQEGRKLEAVFEAGGKMVSVAVRQSDAGTLLIDLGPDPGKAGRAEARRAVREMLSLDLDLSGFHRLCREDPSLRWAARRGAGRMLRAPTAWEDLVKMICTTNCSWSLTRTMTTALVEKAGPRGPGGRRAFPSAADLAGRKEGWFRDVVRAGYRAGYLVELRDRVLDGEIDPDRWRREDADPSAVEAELRSIRGVGPYAAENMMRLLGRHGHLALDSWCRSVYARLYHDGRKVSDRTIRRRYARYGDWSGLAMWLDLWGCEYAPYRDWHDG